MMSETDRSYRSETRVFGVFAAAAAMRNVEMTPLSRSCCGMCALEGLHLEFAAKNAEEIQCSEMRWKTPFSTGQWPAAEDHHRSHARSHGGPIRAWRRVEDSEARIEKQQLAVEAATLDYCR